MACRQPFIGLGENKPNCLSPFKITMVDRQITVDHRGPLSLSPFPSRLSLLLHISSFLWLVLLERKQKTESLSVGSHLLSESLGNRGLSRDFTQHSNETWTIWPFSFPTLLDPTILISAQVLLLPFASILIFFQSFQKLHALTSRSTLGWSNVSILYKCTLF